jgi:hypothetical protein
MGRYHLYVVLTRTNTVISRLIQLIKDDEFTHAAISLDKELNYMYSFSRKHTYNPFIGRFRKEEINEGLYKLQKSVHGTIIEIEVSKQQYNDAKVLLNHFIDNSNLYKYNYKGLLDGMLNKESCYDNRFLCSEFVYYILKQSGIVDFNISRNLVRPQNLLNLDGGIIYRGNLKDLKYQNNNYNSQEIEVRELSVG